MTSQCLLVRATTLRYVVSFAVLLFAFGTSALAAPITFEATGSVTEVANPSGEEFGERRLIERVKATAAASAEELQQTVIRNVSQFCRGHFHDDITVVAIRVRTN